MKYRILLLAFFLYFPLQSFARDSVSIHGTNVFRLIRNNQTGAFRDPDSYQDYYRNTFNNEVGRSIFRFDLPTNFPTSALIYKVKIKYKHQNGTPQDYYPFNVRYGGDFTHVSNQDDWNYTEGCNFIMNGNYRQQFITADGFWQTYNVLPELVTNVQDRVLALKNQIFLTFAYFDESQTTGQTEIWGQFSDVVLEIVYDTGVRYVLKNNIEAGQLYVSSATKTGTVNSGQNIIVPTSTIFSVSAIEPQIINSIQYLWNDNEGSTNKSRWKRVEASGLAHDEGLNQIFVDTAKNSENNYTIQANLRKYLSISRNMNLPEINSTVSDGIQTNIVEQNSGTLAAPSDYIDGNNNAYKFSRWSDYSTSNPLSITPTDNTTYTAVYKAVSASNDSAEYAKPGARKFIRTISRTAFPNGILFNTYESMGQIWLETSTDNGATWQIFNNNHPISGSSTTCKSPTIAFADNNNGTTGVAVIYYDNVTSGTSYASLKYIMFNFSSTLSPIWYRQYTIYSSILRSSTSELYVTADMYGSVDIQESYRLLVVYGTSGWGNFSYWFGRMDAGNTTVIGTGSISTPYNTDMKNPALACSSKFHLVYQGGNKAIYYTTLTENPQGLTLIQDSTRNISTGNSYTSNEHPSITIPYNGSIQVAWRAYKTWNNSNGLYTISSACLTKIAPSLTYSTYDTNCVQVSLNSAFDANNDGYVLGWSSSHPTPYSNFFVKSSDAYTIRNFNTSGKYLRVCNGWGSGTDYSDMACLSYNTTALPYKFNQSASSVMQKSIITESAVSRAGVVFKDSAQFMFQFGDISVDGKSILFPELPDSGFVNSLNFANGYLVSNPFTVTNNSTFQYSVAYGTSDTLNAKAVLGELGKVLFKLQLEDAQSGEVLGSYDAADFTIKNTQVYKNAAYQVSTNGIGSRTVVLRLIAGSNMDMQCTIVRSVEFGSSLDKKNFVSLDYKGNAKVTDYAISQNYPNPFNPSTMINYQIPKGGFVSIKVYDINGNEVANLVNETKEPGNYGVEFNAKNLASGVYFYRIISGDFVQTKKMAILK